MTFDRLISARGQHGVHRLQVTNSTSWLAPLLSTYGTSIVPMT
jgi:hypothetical protein